MSSKYLRWLIDRAFNLQDYKSCNRYYLEFYLKQFEEQVPDKAKGMIWLLLKDLQYEGFLKITKKNQKIFSSLFPNYNQFDPKDNPAPKPKYFKPQKLNPLPKLF